jgi:hypothetical protein
MVWGGGLGGKALMKLPFHTERVCAWGTLWHTEGESPYKGRELRPLSERDNNFH